MEACHKERMLRISHLKNGGAEEKKLANKLEMCRGRCQSLACPVCTRRYRRWMYSRMCRLFQNSTDLVVITIVSVRDKIRKENLYDYPISRIKNRYYQVLRRMGFKGVAIGAVDIDFLQHEQVYQAHIHFVAMGMTKQQIQQLRMVVKNKPDEMERPLKVQKLKDMPQQLTYVIKFLWRRKERCSNQNIGGVTRKVRLYREEHKKSLVKMDRSTTSQMVLMFGVRRIGDWLEKTDK